MARKVEFNVDAALHKAMKLFWLKGYAATSMQDLVTDLNVNRFSIYNSIGDKKGIFLKALDRYRNVVFSTLIEPLNSSEATASKRLDNYFHLMSMQLQSRSGSLGCMIQNTSLSFIAEDSDVAEMLSVMLDDLKSALIRTIDDAKREGDMTVKTSSEVLANYILCQIQGLIIVRKTLNDAAMIASQVDLLRRHVANW